VPEIDRLSLTGLDFYGYHGALPEERARGQHFICDVTVEFDMAKAGDSDRLEDTIDYPRIHAVVREVVEGEPCNLLEAVAERVARAVLAVSEQLQAVTVRVTKPRPPLPGSNTGVSVEIRRERAT
jgi:dihydroneopterin aldolase